VFCAGPEAAARGRRPWTARLFVAGSRPNGDRSSFFSFESGVNQPIASRAREPNPKPLIIALMVVAFFGGSCTVQKMMGAPAEIPDEQQVAKMLENQGLKEQVPPEMHDDLVGAFHGFLEDQIRQTRSLRSFTIAFGIFLAAAYSFVLVFGTRALAWAPGSARGMSVVSFVVLPARVAMAAIDVAIARNLQPAMERLAQTMALASQRGAPEAEAAHVAEVVGRMASWMLLGWQAFLALAVCLLFFFAHRYFQRTEVHEYFDRRWEQRMIG
jgi:hypothetical protein